MHIRYRVWYLITSRWVNEGPGFLASTRPADLNGLSRLFFFFLRPTIIFANEWFAKFYTRRDIITGPFLFIHHEYHIIILYTHSTISIYKYLNIYSS